MNSRKDARQAVATLLESDPTLVEVYDHETKDFGGLTPVAMVHSDGTSHGPGQFLSGYQRSHALLISLWWNREGATTEDNIDDLSEAILDLLEANRGPSNDWGSLEIDDGYSQLDYPILDGVMYRREQIRVIVW